MTVSGDFRITPNCYSVNICNMSTANLLDAHFDDSEEEEDFNPQPADESDAGSDVEDEADNQVRGEAARRHSLDEVSEDEPTEPVKSKRTEPVEDEENDEDDDEGEDTAPRANDDDEEDEDEDEEDEEITVSIALSHAGQSQRTYNIWMLRTPSIRNPGH